MSWENFYEYPQESKDILAMAKSMGFEFAGSQYALTRHYNDTFSLSIDVKSKYHIYLGFWRNEEFEGEFCIASSDEFAKINKILRYTGVLSDEQAIS